MKNIKCTFIGDGAIGKTSLIFIYRYGSFPAEYSPLFINGNVIHNIMYEDQSIKLNIQDIYGQKEIEDLINYVIPNTNVFIFCFSLVVPYSLKRLQELWLPHIKEKCPETPYILVGLKSDLRDSLIREKDLSENDFMRPISTSEGEEMCRNIKAQEYIECSSLKNYHVHDVFISAIKQAIIYKNSTSTNSKKKKSSKCNIF